MTRFTSSSTTYDGLPGRFATIDCRRCHGTGVTASCGNRDAEKTCDRCHGAGRDFVFLADKPAEQADREIAVNPS